MKDLEKAIGLILATHPGPVAERLMLDLWALGLRHGESEGLRYAQMYANSFHASTRSLGLRCVRAESGSETVVRAPVPVEAKET